MWWDYGINKGNKGSKDKIQKSYSIFCDKNITEKVKRVPIIYILFTCML